MANDTDCPGGTTNRNRRTRGSLSARRSRLAMTLAAGLAGGTLFSACQTRTRDAFVSSSKDLFLSLLSPESLLDAFGAGTEETTDEE